MDGQAWERGSSPHTRGAPTSSAWGGRPDRIIPAYAGSTSSYPTCELPRTDHPRIRGEHDKDQHTQSMIMGSSPHTRGAPSQLFDGGRQLGIIPAYAGSTPASW